VREQRVGLEDRVHIPLVRRQHRDILPAQHDPTFGRQLESTHHAQGRRLAAPRWAQQREELALPQIQIDVIDRAGLGESLGHMPQTHCGRGGIQGVCHVGSPVIGNENSARSTARLL
jgi:hypothetical protein